MRTPVWITIVAVAGIVVAWLVLTRSPEPKVATLPPTQVPATIAAPAPPDESEAAAVHAQTEIPPPEPPVVETKPPPAPVAVVPPKPAERATTEAIPGDDSDASANDESADEPEPAEEDTDSQSFDARRAADLLADSMAKQDVAAGDEGSTPMPSSHDLKAFDQEEADPSWSTTAQQHIEATLNQWLDALPGDVRDNFGVIHVECRQTLCQVLTAEGTIVPEGNAAYEPQWTEGIATLVRQPWYHELGFADMTSTVIHDTDSGYFLYQVYLSREVQTPSE